MPPMQSIPRPDGNLTLENAVEAVRPSFDDLVSLADVSVEAAAGPDMPETFLALARRAESVGWTLDIAEDAIRQLAHEYLGARGAFAVIRYRSPPHWSLPFHVKHVTASTKIWRVVRNAGSILDP